MALDLASEVLSLDVLARDACLVLPSRCGCWFGVEGLRLGSNSYSMSYVSPLDSIIEITPRRPFILHTDNNLKSAERRGCHRGVRVVRDFATFGDARFMASRFGEVGL